MTEPRHNRVSSTRSATTAARLPQITAVRTGNASLDGWIGNVTEVLQQRMGNRNPFERALTVRDMDDRLTDLGVIVQSGAARPPDGAAVAVAGPNGTTAFVSIDAFAQSIKNTKLFTDLTRRIDDPARFSGLPDRIRQLLEPDVAELRAVQEATTRRIEEASKTASDSLALILDEAKASISGAAAGVRRLSFASANLNRATAGIVTTISARLDDFDGGGATVETTMTAVADRVTGTEAQYVVKVAAGGYMAGIGLASTAGGVGGAAPTSAFIVQADKFAIVSSSYTGGLTNSPASTSIMFGVDGDGAYVGGNLKVAGKALIDGVTTVSGGYTANAALVLNSGGAAFSALYAYGNSNSDTAYFVNNYGGPEIVGAIYAEGLIGVSGVSTNNATPGINAVAFTSTGLALSVSGTSTFTKQITSSLATGTAPFSIASTTVVTNLNADGVDGYHAGNSSGQVAVSNGTLCTNLNAQYLNGLSHASYCQIVVTDTGTATVSGTGLNMTCAIAGYQFAGSSNVITLQVVSDRRLKRDIEPEALGLDFIRALSPRTYRMKNNPEMLYHGFIYDEVAEVLPREGDSLNQRRPDGYGGVDYVSLIAPIVKGIQQQDGEVQTLRERVTSLEQRVQQLEAA